jgi:hypothetical protein
MNAECVIVRGSEEFARGRGRFASAGEGADFAAFGGQVLVRESVDVADKIIISGW